MCLEKLTVEFICYRYVVKLKLKKADPYGTIVHTQRATVYNCYVIA